MSETPLCAKCGRIVPRGKTNHVKYCDKCREEVDRQHKINYARRKAEEKL